MVIASWQILNALILVSLLMLVLVLLAFLLSPTSEDEPNEGFVDVEMEISEETQQRQDLDEMLKEAENPIEVVMIITEHYLDKPLFNKK